MLFKLLAGFVVSAMPVSGFEAARTSAKGELDVDTQVAKEKLEGKNNSFWISSAAVVSSQFSRRSNRVAVRTSASGEHAVIRRVNVDTNVAKSNRVAVMTSASGEHAVIRRVDVDTNVAKRSLEGSSNSFPSSSAGAGQIKVALLYRGESFRTQGRRNDILEKARRSTCVDEKLTGFSSRYSQKTWTASHNQMATKMAKLGIHVDVYGVTYPCRNGLNYTGDLPEMYTPKMKGFKVIPFAGSNQMTPMKHALKMALTSGEKYDGFYFLRWDYTYDGALTAMNQASCFAESRPMHYLYFEGGNPDGLLYIPGAQAEKFMAYMELGFWQGKRLIDGQEVSSCCNCGDCNRCLQHFIGYLEKKKESEVDLMLDASCKQPPCVCTCAGCRGKSFLKKERTMDLHVMDSRHSVHTNEELCPCADTDRSCNCCPR